ncbi:MAG: hypothetical protein AAFV59_11870 [Pseudomonadota bacterium]
MAIKSENGVTTLSPGSMRWFLSGLCIFLIPGFGPFAIIALIYLLVTSGFFQRLKLTPQGLVHSKWSSTHQYAWSDISDFRVQKIRTGIFSSSSMVTFTHQGADENLLGKTAKFLSGGTHSVPSFGMKPAQLILLMQAYQLGHVPSNTVTKKTDPISAAIPIAASLLAGSDEKPKPARRPERPQPAPRPRAPEPAMRAKPTMAVKPNVAKARKVSSTPLVQEGGGLFGRRRSDSPFRS